MSDPGQATDLLDTPAAGGRVVRGGALRVAGYVATTLLSLGSIVVLTSQLGVVDFGRFVTVLSLATIVQAVTDLGMATLGVREYAQRRGADRDEFLRVLLGLRLVVTGAGMVAIVALALVLGYDRDMVVGALLAGLGLVVLVVQTTVAIPLNVQLRLGVLAALDVSRQALTSVGLVVLALAGAGIAPLLAVTVPAHLVLLAATVALVRTSRVPLRPTIDLARFRALVVPALVFAMATAAGTIYLYSALIVCELVATPLETGWFSASHRIFLVVAAVPGLVVAAAFPVLARAARDDRTRLAYASQRLFEGSALLGGAAALTCVLGAEPIVDVIAGEDYGPAAPVLRIQGAALLLTFVIATWGFTLLALHRHRGLAGVNALAFAASAGTVAVLASAYGERGAAWGTVIGEAVLAVGYVVVLVRADRALRPSAQRLVRALPGGAAALAVLLIPGVPPVADVLLGLALYGAGALLLRAVPDEILEIVPRPARA